MENSPACRKHIGQKMNSFEIICTQCKLLTVPRSGATYSSVISPATSCSCEDDLLVKILSVAVRRAIEVHEVIFARCTEFVDLLKFVVV